MGVLYNIFIYWIRKGEHNISYKNILEYSALRANYFDESALSMSLPFRKLPYTALYVYSKCLHIVGFVTQMIMQNKITK